MKRRAFITMLVLGVLTTLAVAWTSALWSTTKLTGITLSPGHVDPAMQAVVLQASGLGFERTARLDERGRLHEGWPTEGKWDERTIEGADTGSTPTADVNSFLRYYAALYGRIEELSVLSPEAWQESDIRLVLEIEACCGWPLCAMSMSTWGVSNAEGGGRYFLFDSIRVPAGLPKVDPGRAIPLKPRLIGFALDTAFYAAAWWVVLSAPFALRRLIWRKRGLCGMCGYDLRGRGAAHEKCPECGMAIKHAHFGQSPPSPQPSPSEGEGARVTAS